MYITLFSYVARVRDVLIKNIDLQKFKYLAEKVIWRPSWTFDEKKTLDAGKRYKINKIIFLLDTNVNIIVYHDRTLSFFFIFALWLFLHVTFNFRLTLATLLVGLCWVFLGTRGLCELQNISFVLTWTGWAIRLTRSNQSSGYDKLWLKAVV